MSDVESPERPAGPLVDEQSRQHQVRDAYGLALALILFSTFALIAVPAPLRSPFAVGAALLQVGALLVTLRVSGASPRARTGFGAAVLAVAFFSMLAIILGGDSGHQLGLFMWTWLTVGTVVAIVRRIRSYRSVNVQLVLGLLCIYLLIGVTFALLYLLVQAYDPLAFKEGPQNVSGTTYYSFITLATVGYGDITPVNSVMRAMAVAEAILGQLYLVSVVGLAVSRLSGKGRAEL